jgi:hypothetical protein
MNRFRYVSVAVVLVCLLVGQILLSGCEPEVATVVVTSVPEEIEVVVTSPPEVVYEATEEPTEEATEAPVTGSARGQAVPVASSTGPNRLIIKNAEIALRVSDTAVAVDRTTQIVTDVGGYIISSRVWYEEWLEESYQYATITMGVPVDQFERAMRRLRELAVQVVDERASGEDVTDEYVDLESRLENLEATRDRIRQFLEQAETVEEAVMVNEELTIVEGQIEQVQGRMNYLFDRASYSTITVQIEPELAPATPTPAPSWSPSQTLEEAGDTLGAIGRTLVDAAIWMGVVGVPVIGPPVLLVWIVWRTIRRRRKRSDSEDGAQPVA